MTHGKKVNPLTGRQISEISGVRGFRLVNKHEAAAILGVSPETLKKYRLQENSPLIEGVHYHVWNSRTIRYNCELIADWGLNRINPEQHQRNVEAYLKLLSNQKRMQRSSSHIAKSS
jgi:hypothetical protein